MTDELMRLFIETKALTPPSDLERRRAYRDLTLVCERLRTGVYGSSDPLDNSFHIPNRNAEIAWDLRYLHSLGVCWEALLRGAGVTAEARALSVCSGSRPKAELGLAFAGFSGTLTCLNRNARELKELATFLQLFGVRWPLTLCSGDLFAPPTEPFPLVLANHIIDDLCYDQFARAVDLTPDEIYADERSAALFWERVHPTEVVDEISSRLAAALVAWCKPGGTIILVQYQSPFEELLGLRGCRQLCRAVQNALAKRKPQQFQQLSVPTVPGDGPIRSEDCCLLRRLP